MAEHFSTAIRYSISACCGVAVVENLFVLAVFVGTKKLRIKYYAFIFNLALADLVFAVLGTTIPWFPSSTREGFLTAAYTVSVLSIFVAGINRYLSLSITPPARYDSLVTGCRLIGVCSIMWCVAIAYGMLIYLVVLPAAPEIFDAIHIPGYTVAVFILWAVTALAYSLAFRKIKQYTPPLASTAGVSVSEERDQTRARQTRRLLTLFVIILVTAFFSWLPYHILLSIGYFNPYLFFDATFWALRWLAILLYTLSTVINPLIYWWRLDGFKEGFYAIFCRCVIKAGSRQTEVDMSKNENTVVETGF